MDKRLCVLGECMLEIGADRLVDKPIASKVGASLSYGGDTLNTALYYARLGGRVDYLTALGDDSLSDWMIDCWRSEGIGCEFVERTPNAAPGLYLIQLDDTGERSFTYWRGQSAARALLQDATALAQVLARAAQQADLVYLSGISLALMSPESHAVLFEFASGFRARGGLVAFDSNHRPRLWQDAASAKHCYEQMYAHCDIALSTADDEYALFGGASPTDVIERLRGSGPGEILVKDGAKGCALCIDGVVTLVPAKTTRVVDTTAAGDSFNAAYLHSRAIGKDAMAAVHNGHQLAATVVGQPGAIIPTNAMPNLE